MGGMVPAQARQAAPPPAAIRLAEDPAFDALLKRGKAGDVTAYVDLAFDYLDKDNPRHDFDEGVRWLTAGAAAGDAEVAFLAIAPRLVGALALRRRSQSS